MVTNISYFFLIFASVETISFLSIFCYQWFQGRSIAREAKFYVEMLMSVMILVFVYICHLFITLFVFVTGYGDVTLRYLMLISVALLMIDLISSINNPPKRKIVINIDKETGIPIGGVISPFGFSMVRGYARRVIMVLQVIYVWYLGLIGLQVLL